MRYRRYGNRCCLETGKKLNFVRTERCSSSKDWLREKRKTTTTPDRRLNPLLSWLVIVALTTEQWARWFNFVLTDLMGQHISLYSNNQYDLKIFLYFFWAIWLESNQLPISVLDDLQSGKDINVWTRPQLKQKTTSNHF